MKKYLSPIIDKLQATFPPNRVAIALFLILAPTWAWLAKRGIELDPVTTIAVIAGALALLYKWLDGWQAGEPLSVTEEALERAFEEIVAGHQTINGLIGATAGIGQALAQLRDRVTESTINPAELAEELEAIEALLDQAATEAETPDVEVVPSAPAAPPTAAE